MFPISIYTGGAVEYGPMGATYSKPSLGSYPAEDGITFEELKRVIFQLTGIDEGKNGINVNARWNAGTAGSFCFMVLPVCENTMWRMVVEKTISGATGWSVVELYVDLVSNSVVPNSVEKSHQSVTEGIVTEDARNEVQGKEEKSQELTDEESESIDVKPHGESDLYTGRIFSTQDDLKRAVSEYHIRQNRKFVTKKSSKRVYTVKCEAAPKCGWRLYAVGDKNGNYFQITTIKGEHVCSNEGERGNHKNLKSPLISRLILDLIKQNGDASLKEIQELVHERYACTPSFSKLWRAKKRAKAHLFGDWKKSYAKLAPYFNAIQVANPGTKVQWWSDGTDDPNVRLLRGVAWAFAPAVEGFTHCRPVIGVDGTLLHGKYGGMMLLVVGYDAESQVLPLAFAVVKVEDDESWSWFMRWLRAEVVGPRPLCVISDRRGSISRLFDQPDSGWCTTMGQAFPRYCSRHLSESLRLASTGTASKKADLVKLFKWVSRQNQLRKFHLGMSRILETDREVYNLLVKVGTKPNEESAYHLWSLCEDGGCRYGIMAVNGKESVFNIFPQIRELPITALVELTFGKSAEIFTRKREAASKIDAANQLWSNKVMAILEARRAKSLQHQIASWHGEVEVETRSKVKHVVRLGHDQSSCTCQKPQLTGIPCSHLLAVCAFRSFPGDHLVNAAYGTRQLLATWAPQLHPPGGPDEWPDYTGIVYEPDRSSVIKGRKLIKSCSGPIVLRQPREVARSYRCSLCRETGHRKKRCLRYQDTPPGITL